MTETSIGDHRTTEDARSREQVSVPAWEAKFKLSENPEEFAHLVCCRDLDWRQALCGYVEEDPTLMYEAENICTMCVDTATRMGAALDSGQCPIDNQRCPPEEEIDKLIAERASRT